MNVQLALYKGPPRNDVWHSISHYAIRLWTWSKWSHAELVLDGVCYSSSTRDGGVRGKQIDLGSGRWDVLELAIPEAQAERAKTWFMVNDGDAYDWAGILRFVFPFLPHGLREWICFEAIGAALGFAGAHKLTANDLFYWAQERQNEALNFREELG